MLVNNAKTVKIKTSFLALDNTLQHDIFYHNWNKKSFLRYMILYIYDFSFYYYFFLLVLPSLVTLIPKVKVEILY